MSEYKLRALIQTLARIKLLSEVRKSLQVVQGSRNIRRCPAWSNFSNPGGEAVGPAILDKRAKGQTSETLGLVKLTNETK